MGRTAPESVRRGRDSQRGVAVNKAEFQIPDFKERRDIAHLQEILPAREVFQDEQHRRRVK
jgi:hypothetical protein